MGGSVASFIASKTQVDFLFVDRSFASLQAIAYWFGGGPLLWVFKIFTFGGLPDMNLQNYQSVSRAETYKVMSSDANDRIVSDLASIKSGLALKLVRS